MKKIPLSPHFNKQVIFFNSKLYEASLSLLEQYETKKNLLVWGG